MRLFVLAASALALAACSPSETKPEGDGATAAPAPAEHAMDDSMKASDTADDANKTETLDGYTFHTFPDKVEIVHLPVAAGQGVWTPTPSDAALVEVGEQKDETMPNGAVHHTVKVTPKKSGNAEVKFERRDTAVADAPVVETRTIKFMIH